MAGRIPQSFIDDLVSRADIVEVIDAHVPLKKAGREHKACCPFHEEKTPSFTVSSEKQFYHCFGCGAHGTAIGFLMEYEHMDFVEAIEHLAAREAYEIEVIETYKPAALGDAEVDALIDAAIAETGATGMKEMGKVMGALKPRLQGRADMGAVSAKVKARLAG